MKIVFELSKSAAKTVWLFVMKIAHTSLYKILMHLSKIGVNCTRLFLFSRHPLMTTLLMRNNTYSTQQLKEYLYFKKNDIVNIVQQFKIARGIPSGYSFGSKITLLAYFRIRTLPMQIYCWMVDFIKSTRSSSWLLVLHQQFKMIKRIPSGHNFGSNITLLAYFRFKTLPM